MFEETKDTVAFVAVPAAVVTAAEAPLGKVTAPAVPVATLLPNVAATKLGLSAAFALLVGVKVTTTTPFESVVPEVAERVPFALFPIDHVTGMPFCAAAPDATVAVTV